MTHTDTIYSYLLNDKQIRGYFLVAPNLSAEISSLNTTKNNKSLLREALSLTALVSALAKDQQRLSFRLRQKNGLNKLSTDGFSTGQLTGYLNNLQLPVNFKGGTLQLIQTDKTGSSYTSFVGLETGDLYDDFANFFTTSAQNPTVFLSLSTSSTDNTICLLQALPDCSTKMLNDSRRLLFENREAINSLLKNAKPTTPALLDSILPSAHYLTDQTISYTCGCSAELFSRMLFSLSQEELRTVIANQETLTSQCSLCGTVYSYSPEYLALYLVR